MDLLWTVPDMVEAMSGRPIGTMPEGVNGISIDSRNITDRDAFFAVKGDKFDGHDFASAALANGAAIIVVSEDKLPSLGTVNGPMIVVADVLKALEDLGEAARQRTDAKIIAVTGSVGKTTTKEMLRTCLAPSGKVHASLASFNNHWGVPLTLARMAKDTEFGVFEVGMNHPGEIQTLIQMVRPHVALITIVAPAHMGNFENIEEIASAKAEIMEGLIPGGKIILNRDNDQFEFLVNKANELGLEDYTRSFGAHDQADFRLQELVTHNNCSCFTAILNQEKMAVKLGAPGSHLVKNAMAALGACVEVEADIALAAIALTDFRPEKGRGARTTREIINGTFTLIDESYNANPLSMRAAIDLLKNATTSVGGRRIAVLGDMLEMGRFSHQAHIDLAGALYEANIDIVALSGPDMNYLAEVLKGDIQVYYRADLDALIDWLLSKVRAGDVVMVKASLGIGFGKIVKKLQGRFPEYHATSEQSDVAH